MNYYKSIKSTDPTSKQNQLQPQIQIQPAQNNTEKPVVSEEHLIFENKFNTLVENIQKISDENKKLGSLLKTIADMQFYTFQKIKDYQKTIDNLNIQLNTNNKEENINKSNLKKNKKEGVSFKEVNPEIDDDEMTNLIEKEKRNDFLDP